MLFRWFFACVWFCDLMIRSLLTARWVSNLLPFESFMNPFSAMQVGFEHAPFRPLINLLTARWEWDSNLQLFDRLWNRLQPGGTQTCSILTVYELFMDTVSWVSKIFAKDWTAKKKKYWRFFYFISLFADKINSKMIPKPGQVCPHINF